ncbi:glycoside hydrolase family 15 protein [bacterium]|nr:glycoside hydrolase family 15 protein [bacterium]MBU1957843.1 glycoside hydrolase family 15 protein [bacterium]
MNLNRLHTSLERHFEVVEKIILSRQDAITGLLPASTAVNAHGDYTDAWVRDNVYSILSVWGLALAYRKHDEKHYRSYFLSQSVVKLMRGLLMAMMRQSDRIETFKVTHNPTDALHAKYGTKTGLAVVGDDEWGHLQLDATSLFLLMMAQMTASGLRIVYTMDEVDFVQNLVHYISHTYCTADYGIWERGNKINHGTTEINGSSVGMAKAALEVMDGFNLFGEVESEEGIIHVISSDVARSRFTLQGLLPRESISKETDAALLSIVGYPAYAVEDKKLLKRTRDKIIKKLAGNYGCKRFLLDGHQSSIEDSSRLHYEPSELAEFKDIESEWPLFFTYLLLDALMREDEDEVKHWHEKLKPLFVEQDGEQLLPELYIVPKALVEAEKETPGSQIRVANENVPLVWAQSLYMLSDMMLDGLLAPEDLDPLNRRQRIGYTSNPTPLVPILAENEFVKQHLHVLGFNSETVEELKSIRIAHASQLSKLHTLLGKNEKLSLTGRPLMVSRTMTTARLHLLEGKETIFLPYYFNPEGFYFSNDNKLLVEHFRASLQFLSKQWDGVKQPIIPMLVRESMLTDINRVALLELLSDIKKGESETVEIETGSLEELLSKASVERIDCLKGFAFENAQLSHKELSISLCVDDITQPQIVENIHELDTYVDDSLVYTLLGNSNHLVKTHALELLWERQGKEFEVLTQEGTVTLASIAEKLYESATVCDEWVAVRRIAELTGKYDDRLEDVLLDITIHQKRLGVGRAYDGRATFSTSHSSSVIIETIAAFCGDNVAENVLTQEIILHLGQLIRTEPELFETMLTLRTWYFIQLLIGNIGRKANIPMSAAYEVLLGLAPHSIYNRLRLILKEFTEEVTYFRNQENLQSSGVLSLESLSPTSLTSELSSIENWAQWREERGMLGLRSEKFYKDIWYLLRQCQGLVIGNKYDAQNRMGSALTLDSTAGEHSFALIVDTLLQRIHAPDYRQLNIEALESMSRVFKENPNFYVENDLVLDILIGHAVRFKWEKSTNFDNYNDHRSAAWEAFYKLSPKETDEAFIGALMELIAPKESENE